MYLSLRTNDVDMEDTTTGENVFSIYLKKKDISRMKQLLMRGADVNYVNKITRLTPLHQAIERELNSKIIKFLLISGANPHIEDKSGIDCCDKARDIHRYNKIKALNNHDCRDNPALRVKANTMGLTNQLTKGLKQMIDKSKTEVKTKLKELSNPTSPKPQKDKGKKVQGK
jgi:ankyrin repeat protein